MHESSLKLHVKTGFAAAAGLKKITQKVIENLRLRSYEFILSETFTDEESYDRKQ